MKYRAEIDGLRALAVVPVIMFHVGFELFSGGFVGVDVFFVISGYLITTILVEDIEKNRFSIVRFYERRARRIMPVLFVVLLCTTIAANIILFPKDLNEYSKSLISALLFFSNIFFWINSDYFATDAALTPLLHTWSLAVEEQYYLLFPIFLLFSWRFGKNRVFWAILILAVISLALSEYGWRNNPKANFYLAPTRAWELFAGSIAAFIVQKRGVQADNILASLGLVAIVFSLIVYDENTPFPSVYTLLPVSGVVLLVLYAENKTYVAKILSTKVFVGIGLISYSAYLWHQPLLALYRRKVGVNLDLDAQLTILVVVVLLSIFTWNFVEQPFRGKTKFKTNSIFSSVATLTVIFVSFSLIVVKTNGTIWRFGDLPKAPSPWVDVKCHGAKRISNYENPMLTCLGDGSNNSTDDLYLLGDSHAAQLTFALNIVADKFGKKLYFINTEDRDDYPHTFWEKELKSNRTLDYLLSIVDEGDIVITSFHRGQLNKSRDVHIKENLEVVENSKSKYLLANLLFYTEKFNDKRVPLVLVKDGPLLKDTDTMLEECMHKYLNGVSNPCSVKLSQDLHTRSRQSNVFEKVYKKYRESVYVLDPLPELYKGHDEFSPISMDGKYLMHDRHHLAELGSLRLVAYFEKQLGKIVNNNEMLKNK